MYRLHSIFSGLTLTSSYYPHYYVPPSVARVHLSTYLMLRSHVLEKFFVLRIA
jgi:hypothetical protein